jgi:hypothetical protein
MEENVCVSNIEYDKDTLNLNLEYIHERLYDSENSPYLFIKKTD